MDANRAKPSDPRPLDERLHDELIDAVDEELIAAHLFTADLPDPDLLIRTSGEQRISNFLLWQCAYAELVFTKTLWPDFGRSDLEHAIADYCGRERRYGASVGSR